MEKLVWVQVGVHGLFLPLKGTECSFSWEQDQNKRWKLVFIRWGPWPQESKAFLGSPRGGAAGVRWPLLALAEKLLPLLRNKPKNVLPSALPSTLENSILRQGGSMPRWEERYRDFLGQSPSSCTAEQKDSRKDHMWSWELAACKLCFVSAAEHIWNFEPTFNI